MEQILFVQKVKESKKDSYIEYHKNCPPDLLKEMKAAGIDREMIWILDDLLIVYVMAKDFEKSMDILGKKDVFKKWIKIMGPLLAEMQDYSGEGKINKLDKIFDLEKQLKGLDK